jgi:dienelactone hydrolase
LATCLTYILVPSSIGWAQSVVAWSGLPAGPHPVGYELQYLIDSTRTTLPDTLTARRQTDPRVIPVRIWYPAVKSAAPLPFDSIIAVGPSGPAVAAPLLARTLAIHAYAARKYAGASGTEVLPSDTSGLIALALRTPTAARRGRPDGRKYPVMVFAGGTAHSVDENVGLWEYLASFGYVVAAFPSVAADRDTAEAYLPADAVGLETMARDLELVLSEVRRRPDADPRPAGAMGFSFGGAAALIAAGRRSDIGAVVGLDPSFIAGRHLATMRSSPLFDLRRVTVPLLEFHRADTTVNLTLVRELSRSSRTSIEITGLDHVDFNSYVLLYAPLLARRRPLASRDSVLAIKAATYRSMAQTLRGFLDATLRQRSLSETERRGLDGGGPFWVGVPRELLRVHRWERLVR